MIRVTKISRDYDQERIHGLFPSLLIFKNIALTTLAYVRNEETQ